MKKRPKDEILKQVQEKAFKYEKEYYGCSQCVLLAIQEVFEMENENTFKAATGYAGGIGLTGSVCGALLGGIMAIGLKYGRDLHAFFNRDPEKVRFKSYMLAAKLRRKFEETYGSCFCRDIQKKLFGKWYNLFDPKEFEEFEKAGGHGPQGCPTVVKNAARWVSEILLAE